MGNFGSKVSSDICGTFNYVLTNKYTRFFLKDDGLESNLSGSKKSTLFKQKSHGIENF